MYDLFQTFMSISILSSIGTLYVYSVGNYWRYRLLNHVLQAGMVRLVCITMALVYFFLLSSLVVTHISYTVHPIHPAVFSFQRRKLNCVSSETRWAVVNWRFLTAQGWPSRFKWYSISAAADRRLCSWVVPDVAGVFYQWIASVPSRFRPLDTPGSAPDYQSRNHVPHIGNRSKTAPPSKELIS